MDSVSVEIFLPASPERVWKALAGYYDSDAGMALADMDAAAALHARVRLKKLTPAGEAQKYTYARVLAYQPLARLELQNGVPLLTQVVRFYHLSPVEGGTLLRNGTRLSGRLVRGWFSKEGRAQELRDSHHAFGKFLTDRLAGRVARHEAGNRHTRRSEKARTRR